MMSVRKIQDKGEVIVYDADLKQARILNRSLKNSDP